MAFKKVLIYNKKRPEGKNCVMVYGFSEAEMVKILPYSVEMEIDTCIEIKPEHVDTIVRDCIEGVFHVSEREKTIETRVVLLNAVSDYQLHHFVENFKKLGLKRPLFANVTKTSMAWTFSALIAELSAERKALEK